MRILVVEDDPALRLGLRRTLLSEGWQVDTVEDGRSALPATATEDFDLASTSIRNAYLCFRVGCL